MNFSVLIATDSKFGIGRNNTLPWRGTPQGTTDMNWFTKITTEHPRTAVIMGRTTWESIPPKSRPLPGRINIVLSTKHNALITQSLLTDSPIVYVNSLDAALEWCNTNAKRAFVIGGAQIYKLAFEHPLCKTVYMTDIIGDYKCDTFIDPAWMRDFTQGATRSLSWGMYHYGGLVAIYTRAAASGICKPIIPAEIVGQNEANYLRLLGCLTTAPRSQNRTGIISRRLFAQQLRFDLCNAHGLVVPALTTKYVALKSVIVELIWFLRGSSDTSYLKKNNIHIWDANTSREFLDKIGLTSYNPGQTGPIYGAQWRNWNNEGIDQLANIIEKIKTDPTDRRLVVSAWNPSKIPQMVLPPCHYSFQFVVENNHLSCLVNMRSADVALGVPFNIVSYALLTHCIAQITKLKARELVLMMCDCHIYENQLDGIKEQLSREPQMFPQLEFSQKIMDKKDLSIDDFDETDFIINDYHPYPPIKFEMAV